MSDLSSEDTKLSLKNDKQAAEEAGEWNGEEPADPGAWGGLAPWRARLGCGERAAMRALAAIAVALLVATVTLAVTWPRRPHDGTVCGAPSCLRLAAEHLERGDPTTDACLDPRRWACGGWLEDNKRRVPALASWSLHDEIQLRELGRLRNVLSTTSNGGDHDSVNNKLLRLYESCTNIQNVEIAGNFYLLDLLRNQGYCNVLGKGSADQWSWGDALVHLHTKHGVTPLYDVTLTLRDDDPALLLRPAAFGLPHHSFYALVPDEVVNGVQNAYKKLIKEAAIGLGALTMKAKDFADIVFTFEQRLANLMLDNPDDTETKMTTQNFDSMDIYYHRFIKDVFPGMHISNQTKVFVYQPSYFSKLPSITTTATPSVLNDYFTWTLIRQFLPYMAKQYRQLWHDLQSELKGSTEEPSRWQFCAGIVQKVTPLASLALLQSEEDNKRSKATLEPKQHTAIGNIFKSIKLKAIDTIEASTSISSETKSKMVIKTNTLKLQIGLTPYEKGNDFLLNYYENLHVQKDDFFGNIRDALKYERELLQNFHFNKSVFIARVNARKLIKTEASYVRQTETVLLPPTLATLPYFHSDYPQFTQFARVGVTLATALTSFLATTFPEAARTFLAPPCLAGNDSADAVARAVRVRLAGATLALEAARSSVDGDQYLPGLDLYYRDTLFALSYAQSLCSINTQNQIKLDRLHSLIDGKTMLEAAWPLMTGLQTSLKCSIKEKCPTFD